MDLLTSYQGIPHLTSAQFRSIIESITGVGSCIADIDEKMEIELAENNTVKIRSGVLIHHGGVMQIKKGTYDSATYQNGTQAMKRIDLLVARYTKSADTKIEKAEWVIIQGTPDEESPIAPAYTEGNMQDGDLVDDCPFAELHFDGINVVEVVMLVDVTENISTLKEIIKKMLEEIDKLNSNIIDIIRVENITVNMTAKANTTTAVSHTPTPPDGFKLMFAVPNNTAEGACTFATVNVEDGMVSVVIKNWATTAKTIHPVYTAVYVRE